MTSTNLISCYPLVKHFLNLAQTPSSRQGYGGLLWESFLQGNDFAFSIHIKSTHNSDSIK
jgi:hypothetical protein